MKNAAIIFLVMQLCALTAHTRSGKSIKMAMTKKVLIKMAMTKKVLIKMGATKMAMTKKVLIKASMTGKASTR